MEIGGLSILGNSIAAHSGLVGINIGIAIFMERQAQSTASNSGAAYVPNFWNDRPLNFVDTNTIPGCSLVAASGVVLPAGSYFAWGQAGATAGGHSTSQTRLWNRTALSVIREGKSMRTQNVNTQTDYSPVIAGFTLTQTSTISLQYNLNSADGETTATLGPEVYSQLLIVKYA